MNIRAVHNSQSELYRSPFGAVECGESVKLAVLIEGEILSVDLRLWYDNTEYLIPMHRKGDLYYVTAHMPDKPMLVWYAFAVRTDEGLFYYCKGDRFNPVGKLFDYIPHSYQITVYKKGFKAPSWFSDKVMYQIFVDRFYNGNEGGYVYKKRSEYVVSDWNSPVPYDKEHSVSEFAKNDFYGGNLKGIIKKLEYLQELGVGVLYLNPIFDAYSNHKYDTGDYMKIDEMFGNEQILKELCEKAADKGISIILDGVFSHTGVDSRYFNKRGSYDSIGAYQSIKSPYIDWYRFDEYPEKYDCWWGVTTLPNVNEMTNSYRDFIISGEDSVVRHWIRCGIKGWRLDVADELPDKFIRELRQAAKEEDEDAVIIGEVWEDASNKISYCALRQYLLGDELDSVMNYPFKDGIIGYIMGWHGAEYFNRIVMSIYENYPKTCFFSLMNFIGTHDVARAKTLFGNAPDIPMEQRALYKLPYEQELLANKRLRIAAFWQMTFPGVPCIYYGDEIGMQGYTDPFNRGAFSWNDKDEELLGWYKSLIKIRNSFAPLRTGDYTAIIADGDILFYKREIKNSLDMLGRKCENGFAIAVINRSEYDARVIQIDAGKYKSLRNPITNEIAKAEEGFFKLSVAPVSCALYIGEGFIDR